MHNPELHALAAVNWQYFCSFSFRSEKHCARFGPQMFVALVRTQARSFGLHFSEILWCLRRDNELASDEFTVTLLLPSTRTNGLLLVWLLSLEARTALH